MVACMVLTALPACAGAPEQRVLQVGSQPYAKLNNGNRIPLIGLGT